jgi:hypothetical protein
MTGQDALRVVQRLAHHTDRGRRGRPGIKGTQQRLDEEVQLLLTYRQAKAAAALIEAKVREAYGIGA